jgi:uncharacterized membrane protein YgcG
MARIGQFGAWRHGVVGVAVLAGCGLTLAGVIGVPQRPEKFDAKQVLVVPAGDDGVRIREVVDQDFGSEDHHGYERIILDDFGEPTDIEASSPDAPADVNVDQTTQDGRPATRIRLGDPNVTVNGQHRYVLSYTLPQARLSSGQLFLDIIGNHETLSTDHFEVIVAGMTLADPGCATGPRDAAIGTCTLAQSGDTYRATISPLPAGDGITISGTVTGRTDVATVDEPVLPERRDEDNSVPLAIAMLPIGLASGGAVYELARRRGRNEVYAGGAADAAFGPPTVAGTPLPPPGSPPPPTRLVADSEMAALATTEFAPPAGIAPWQGDVLLREKIDNDTVSAWFSGQAARDVITITKVDDEVVLGRGPKFAQADPADAPILAQLFSDGEPVQLDGYDASFSAAWRSAKAQIERSINASGFWRRLPPSAGVGCASALSGPALVFIAVWIVIGAGSILSAALGVFHGPIGGILFGIAVPALAAFAVYHNLLPARSATGSALALRTESFRRFLAASEGRHVEWAWKHGLLREYSAWAVALGTADTWQRAMAATSIPPTEITTGPLLLWSMGPSFTSGYTPPSSSGGGGGGGGGGGFSGSVGGGGGGGSSGSW